MTERREIERRWRSLGEIREIMESMKTLAYLETHKIAKTLEAQRAVVRHVEVLAADLLGSFPELRPSPAGLKRAYVVIGSERGFCGDFNRSLVRELDARPAVAHARIIAVGAKLAPLLEQDRRLAAALPGAAAAEEIGAVLERILAVLAALERDEGSHELIVIRHGPGGGVLADPLLPPFQEPSSPSQRHPPVLDLEPGDLIMQLADQYLLAALHLCLHDGLMAENRSRVAHLEGAVRHLDEEAGKLERRRHAVRQEEIVEEIEVILQSAAIVAKLAEGDFASGSDGNGW